MLSLHRLKQHVRLLIDRSGWYVRPLSRLPFGIDLINDCRRLGLTNLDNPIVFDVGANQAEWTVYVTDRLPAALIYCFEPVAATFAILQHKISTNSNIRCFPTALGAACATRRMFIYDNNCINSFNQWTDKEPVGQIDVAVTTLDAFVAQHSIPHIDLLKIDVEGSELDVIRGGMDTLTQKRVRFILAECTVHSDDNVLTNLCELERALSRVGFVFVTLYTERNDLQRSGRYSYGTALFALKY